MNGDLSQKCTIITPLGYLGHLRAFQTDGLVGRLQSSKSSGAHEASCQQPSFLVASVATFVLAVHQLRCRLRQFTTYHWPIVPNDNDVCYPGICPTCLSSREL